MIQSSWLRTAVVAHAHTRAPLTRDPAYTGHYAYAFRVIASAADRTGKPVYGDYMRARAYRIRSGR